MNDIEHDGFGVVRLTRELLPQVAKHADHQDQTSKWFARKLNTRAELAASVFIREGLAFFVVWEETGDRWRIVALLIGCD